LKVYQRDIVEVNFQFPDGKFKPHPLLVVSNSGVLELEGIFYGLLISSKKFNSEFEFDLSEEMLINPLKKKSIVKCQLLQAYTEAEVLAKISVIKKEPFEEILHRFFKTVFK